jgi:glycosyltransferase involved in cell wall biosynthesis
VELLLKSTALLFVSHYEGYGMPPQEAQSIGCPVILSDIRCHRTVYANPRRLSQLPEELQYAPPFIDPNDEHALASEMQRMIDDVDHRARLRAAGIAYSETFSARDTAFALQSAFESAAIKQASGRA